MNMGLIIKTIPEDAINLGLFSVSELIEEVKDNVHFQLLLHTFTLVYRSIENQRFKSKCFIFAVYNQ